jgi:hypothetical protein
MGTLTSDGQSNVQRFLCGRKHNRVFECREIRSKTGSKTGLKRGRGQHPKSKKHRYTGKYSNGRTPKTRAKKVPQIQRKVARPVANSRSGPYSNSTGGPNACKIDGQMNGRKPPKNGPKITSGGAQNPIKLGNSGPETDQKGTKIGLQTGTKNPVRGVMIIPHLNCSDGTLTIGTKKHVIQRT